MKMEGETMGGMVGGCGGDQDVIIATFAASRAHDPNIWGAAGRHPKEVSGDCRLAAVCVVVDDAAISGVIYRPTHFVADLPL